jgi:peroxiredoxin Q/BCP
MTELNPGDPAPDFTLPASGGKTVSLHDLRGRPVVLYFYPADDTSGCTKEACGFRDHFGDFGSVHAMVLGVSPDPVSSHDAFAEKFNLPFALLADTDHAVAEAYGAWGEKNLYGKKSVGILRTTFLIDEEGRIARVWRRVKPDGHADQVLAALAPVG